MVDNKFDEDVLESDFLDCVLEILVIEDNVVTVPVYKENSFVLYFSMSTSDAGGLEEFLLASIRCLNLHYSALFLLPLTGYELEYFLVVLFFL